MDKNGLPWEENDYDPVLTSIEKCFWFWNKFGAAIWKHVAIKKSSALFNFKYLYTNRKYYGMGF